MTEETISTQPTKEEQVPPQSQESSEPTTKPVIEPKEQKENTDKKKPRKPSSRSKSKSKSKPKPRSTRSVSRTRKNRHLAVAHRNRRNQWNRKGRLFRAQRAAYFSSKNKNPKGRKFFFRRFKTPRKNLRMRKVFVGGLQRSMTSRALYYLFKPEGRLLFAKIVYDKFGYSKGYGLLEFSNPRDAWKVIRKWNGTFYKGLKLKIEYKRFQRRKQGGYKGFRKFYNGGQQFYYGKKFWNQGKRNYNRGIGERKKSLERAS